jgi:hypothetical protein
MIFKAEVRGNPNFTYVNSRLSKNALGKRAWRTTRRGERMRLSRGIPGPVWVSIAHLVSLGGLLFVWFYGTGIWTGKPHPLDYTVDRLAEIGRQIGWKISVPYRTKEPKPDRIVRIVPASPSSLNVRRCLSKADIQTARRGEYKVIGSV